MPPLKINKKSNIKYLAASKLGIRGQAENVFPATADDLHLY
jgi:hypothetical protein